MTLYLQNSSSVSNYYLTELLYTGKCSIQLYRATCPSTQKDYAIKIFTKEKDENSSSFFTQEREIVKDLAHPHMVEYVGFHQEAFFEATPEVPKKECAAIIMEYIPYGDLYKLIVKKPFSEKLARTFFRQMISSLEYLNNKGYAHLDLKPGNFLVSDDGIKLIDFDLSQRLGDDERLKFAKGTPGYRAPEMINGKLRDAKAADIYSLGVLLFTMVAGWRPFEELETTTGEVEFDKNFHTLKRNPIAFWANHNYYMKKSKREKFSKDFQDMVGDLLQEDPNKRPSLNRIKQMKWYQDETFDVSEIKDQLQVYNH